MLLSRELNHEIYHENLTFSIFKCDNRVPGASTNTENVLKKCAEKVEKSKCALFLLQIPVILLVFMPQNCGLPTREGMEACNLPQKIRSTAQCCLSLCVYILPIKYIVVDHFQECILHNMSWLPIAHSPSI